MYLALRVARTMSAMKPATMREIPPRASGDRRRRFRAPCAFAKSRNDRHPAKPERGFISFNAEMLAIWAPGNVQHPTFNFQRPKEKCACGVLSNASEGEYICQKRMAAWFAMPGEPGSLGIDRGR